MAGASAEELDCPQDLYYLPEKIFKVMKEKLDAGNKNEEDFKPLFETIVDPMKLEDDEMMIPVDMRGLEKDFEGIEDVIDELGAVGASEAFVKAREYFLANKDKLPEDERPEPMKASEWKQAIEEDMMNMMEGMEGGEEESLDEEDPEEEVEEPASKKAKTS